MGLQVTEFRENHGTRQKFETYWLSLVPSDAVVMMFVSKEGTGVITMIVDGSCVGAPELGSVGALATPTPSWTPTQCPHPTTFATMGTVVMKNPHGSSGADRVCNSTKTDVTRMQKVKTPPWEGP
jgi:hypothetical protein